MPNCTFDADVVILKYQVCYPVECTFTNWNCVWRNEIEMGTRVLNHAEVKHL